MASAAVYLAGCRMGCGPCLSGLGRLGATPQRQPLATALLIAPYVFSALHLFAAGAALYLLRLALLCADLLATWPVVPLHRCLAFGGRLGLVPMLPCLPADRALLFFPGIL